MTCEVEIVKNIVPDLDEPKSGDCKSDTHVISVVGDTPKCIDFVGVERFDSIINSHLVKVKQRESQINLLPQLMSCKFGKKTKDSSIPSICLLGIEDFKSQLLT